MKMKLNKKIWKSLFVMTTIVGFPLTSFIAVACSSTTTSDSGENNPTNPGNGSDNSNGSNNGGGSDNSGNLPISPPTNSDINKWLTFLSQTFNASSEDIFKSNIVQLNDYYQNVDKKRKNQSVVDLFKLKFFLKEDIPENSSLNTLYVYSNQLTSQGKPLSTRVDFNPSDSNQRDLLVSENDISINKISVDLMTKNLKLDISIDLQGKDYKYLVSTSETVMNRRFAHKITSSNVSISFDVTYDQFLFVENLCTSYDDFILKASEMQKTNPDKIMYVGLIKDEKNNFYIGTSSHYLHQNTDGSTQEVNTAKMKLDLNNGMPNNVENVTIFNWFNYKINLN